MSKCHQQSCCSQNCCGENSSCGSNSCCSDNSCSCSCSCCQKSSCGNHAQKMLELADCAWKEVLKEKMMDYIRQNDHKIDELAKTVCEANQQRWHSKMAKQKTEMDYEQKLKGIFCTSCNK